MAIKSSNQITFSEYKKIIEIKEYYLATSASEGITSDPTLGWTDTIQTIDSTNKYLWNYEEVIYSIGSSDKSEPVIIGYYGQGAAGKGISNIKNYYQITKNLVAPSLPTSNGGSSWSDDTSIITTLSATNKYLWNYEAIIYTDGSTTMTEPAIIGVYGDSGADAITFEIYSPNGFVFKENLKSIDLKIAAFKGSEAITGATYTWEWWDSTLNSNKGGYRIIDTATPQTFTVSEASNYAFANLRCTMTYNGKSYYDYVVLTSETVIYTATVKFPYGRNVFYAEDQYLLAYIDLYQNNNLIEGISLYEKMQYCPGISGVAGKTIFPGATLDESYSDGHRMYFVVNYNGTYKAILGEYKAGNWTEVTDTTTYSYVNSFYPDVQSNIIVIPKEQVNKSVNIEFTVYKHGIHVASTNAMVIDTNDPIVGSEPKDPVDKQLWLDTAQTPNELKIYNKSENRWVSCSEKIGGAVFTSKPTSGYTQGDLWILAANEACKYTLNNVVYEFGPGSMLRAEVTSKTYRASDWKDADAKLTEMKNNIDNYFTFTPSTGLKIAQIGDSSYINIDSDEIGFYSNNTKVVYISGDSANIDNLLVERSLKVDCDSQFNGNVQMKNFAWQTESNGSFSLVRI